VPEPLCERIVDALVERLRTGSEYIYHPDRVIRSPAWGSHCLDESLAAEPTIYTLSPDDEDNEELTYTSTKSSMGIDLTIAKRFTPAGENTPLSVTLDPDRWKVQNRLRDDARKRLRGDLKVGGLALLIQIPLVDLSAEETAVDGWAVVMMRLLVQYTYQDAE
jgi:hypothetical protein